MYFQEYNCAFCTQLRYCSICIDKIYRIFSSASSSENAIVFPPPTESHSALYFGEFQVLLMCVLHCSHFLDNTTPFFHMHYDAPDHTLPPHDKTPTASPSDSFHLPSLKTDDTSPHPYTDRSPAPLFSAKHSHSMTKVNTACVYASRRHLNSLKILLIPMQVLILPPEAAANPNLLFIEKHFLMQRYFAVFQQTNMFLIQKRFDLPGLPLQQTRQKLQRHIFLIGKNQEFPAQNSRFLPVRRSYLPAP